jgi:hypothetical protein
MNDRDWAIVVGISDYSDESLEKLEGPQNDAIAFYEWVMSENGGGVPEEHGRRLLSGDFKAKGSIEPTAATIQALFDHLDEVRRTFLQKEKRKGAFGRRLWVYFSGHGFAPDIDDKLTALLTVDAKAGEFHRSHVITSMLADACADAEYFEQIFMFADCCRTVMPVTQLNVKRSATKRDDRDQVRTFYAYGARIGKESREWLVDGKWRGVFTMTLLEGLRGGAIDRTETPPAITAESLNNFLHNNFVQFMVPEDRERSGIRREPEVVYEHRGTKLTIVPVPTKGLLNREVDVKAYPVSIEARTDGAAGAPFTIRRRGRDDLAGNVGSIVELEPGLYVLSVPTLFVLHPFEVCASADAKAVIPVRV